jgi:endonuclease/exonuclease/phosphatase family metal-dependent hydrolase
MIELVTADRPDIVCLQELPTWTLRRLEDWSSMQSFPAVARHAFVMKRPGGWITRRNQGLLRSALTGQANAILVAAGAAEDLGDEPISDRGRERRLVQAVRFRNVVIANLHASSAAHASEVVWPEIERARAFAERHAREDEAVVLAGDFNLRDVVLPGYSQPAPGIDHIVVKRGHALPPVVWPLKRRMLDDVVLSDHAPVEVVLE